MKTEPSYWALDWMADVGGGQPSPFSTHLPADSIADAVAKVEAIKATLVLDPVPVAKAEIPDYLWPCEAQCGLWVMRLAHYTYGGDVRRLHFYAQTDQMARIQVASIRLNAQLGDPILGVYKA